MAFSVLNDVPSVLLEDVTFTYQGGEKPAVRNINLRIEKGETVMISGPAGAGKTTLCCMLNGLVPHFFGGKLEGKVLVNGLNTKKYNPGYLSHIVGLMFQEPETQLVCPTVMDELAFGPENYGIPPNEIRHRVEESLKATRLEKYRETNPHSLSGGEQQACALGATMTMHPEIFVLDEPTSNIDPIGSTLVLSLLIELSKREKSTMIIVEHKMEELLPFVDRLILMNEGEIVLEGRPRDLLEDVRFMKKIGTKPPQITLLASRLKERYKEITLPLTLEEGFEVFSKLLEGRKESPLAEGGEGEGATETAGPRTGEKIIETKDLWHIYPGGTAALQGVNLSILKGEFVAIIGQNGSGKTTLVKHFDGLLKPTRGKVYIFGVDTETAKISDLSKKVGYCFQNPDFQLCRNTVKEELEFGPRNMGEFEEEISRRMKEVAAAIGFEDILDRKPFSLSKGERQKLAVGSILAMRPDVLIVDEPTTGQDYGMAKEMMEFYRRLNEEEGKTIIVITHDMNLAAEYARRVIVLKDGQILLDGETKSVFSKTEELETTFLKPPQITRLGQLLNKYGIPEDILTVDEMFERITELLEGC